MKESIKALYNEWNYVRGIVISFLENVSDKDQHKTFPRKKYNTILEQCNELYEIQQDYVDAIESKSIQFSGRNLHLSSANEIVHVMKKLDERMERQLECLNGDEFIDWFGEKKNIHQHLCAMISHEMMHVGQIVAFCYAVDITIPDDIIEEMALEG